MSLTERLDLLVDNSAYPGEHASWSRWGQMIRENPTVSSEMSSLLASGHLSRLGELGKVRGGAVTRANAYFLVKEVPFSRIPTRMRVTQSDLRRISVIEDGLNHLSRIERQFLRPVLKGPESLTSAFSTQRTDIRLVDIGLSKQELERTGANGALDYLRRGETVSFKTSSDELKGGVPALRSQVKNRRPFWYSISGAQVSGARIVFPEHVDKRYVFTSVDASDLSVVIDKLFVFEPEEPAGNLFIHAGLNSLFGWYQTELRGRSQLGEGVLELKIPDYQGLLVASPSQVSADIQNLVLEAFSRVPNAGAGPSLEELGSAERLKFDMLYLEACGFSDPEAVAVVLEQELRAMAGERIERKLSVADAKISRRKVTNVAATIDAFAARAAANLSPYPDPRTFIEPDESDELVAVLGTPSGPIEIGTDLFNLGGLFAGDMRIAQASTINAATLVRSVLLIEPTVSSVRVPTGARLTRTHREWLAAGKRWQREFDRSLDRALAGVNDPRTRASVRERALALMHAA